MTKPARKIKRERLHDRLLHGPATKEEIVTHAVVAPFDRERRRMDEKWGIDRLEELVDPVKAARWGEVMAELNEAIEANDPERTKAAVETALRGFAVMDAAAEAAGFQKLPPEVMEGEVDGFRFAVMQDDRFWKAYEKMRPGVPMFSLRQVGLALKANLEANPVIREVKKHFPNSRITSVRPRSDIERELDDEIPF